MGNHDDSPSGDSLPAHHLKADESRIAVGRFAETGISLIGVGAELSEVTIEVGDWRDAELHIETGSALSRLIIVEQANRSTTSSGTLSLSNPDGTSISVEGKVGFSGWRLQNGKWAITIPTKQVRYLELIDATLTTSSLDNQKLKKLVVEGAVGCAGTIQTRLCRLGTGNAPVELSAGTWQLGEVESGPEGPRKLTISNGAALKTKKVSGIQLVELYGPMELSGEIRGAKNLEVRGYSTLTLQKNASIANIRFTSPKDPIGLALNTGSKSLSTSGAVRVLRAKKGAQLTGSHTNPVSVVSLDEVEECVLSRIDLSGLQLSDLPALEAPSVLDPWMAKTRAASIEIERSEGLHRRTFNAPWKRYWAMVKRWVLNFAVLRRDWPEPPFYTDELRQRLAERWVQISRVVSGKQVSSATQSRIRYAAQHWRRLSLQWRWGQLREKLLVTGYWAIGYGERILRPLAAYALLAVALGTLMEPDLFPKDQGLTRDARVQYLVLAPLSVLRVTQGVMAGEHWVIPLVRLFGLLAIGTALLAARRVGRAD